MSRHGRHDTGSPLDPLSGVVPARYTRPRPSDARTTQRPTRQRPHMIRHPSSRSPRLGILSLPSARPAGRCLRAAPGRRLALVPARRPGGIEPIDAVLVGPGGTWAITTAGERGRFARRNGHWYRWNRGTESWVPWDPRADHRRAPCGPPAQPVPRARRRCRPTSQAVLAPHGRHGRPDRAGGPDRAHRRARSRSA